MQSLHEVAECYNVSIFDALDLYYIFGYEKLGEHIDKDMSKLRKVYSKAQLPYLKAEATGESESVLVSSSQDLMKCKDGPKVYYLAKSLSYFADSDNSGFKPDKAKLSLCANIAYNLLKAGETFQTVLLLPAGVLSEFTQDIDISEFTKCYSLIVETKKENTLDFLKNIGEKDVEGIGEKITEYMSKSVRYEKKQEQIKTANTVGKIAGKTVWRFLARKITLALAPYASIGSVIIAGIAAFDLLVFILGLVFAWNVTWFAGILGTICALYLIWGWWIEGLEHPVRWLLCTFVGSGCTIVALVAVIINAVKTVAGG